MAGGGGSAETLDGESGTAPADRRAPIPRLRDGAGRVLAADGKAARSGGVKPDKKPALSRAQADKVTAPTAVLADALSTAIAVAPEAAAKTILVKGGGEEAILVDRRGRLVRLRA